MSCRVRKIHEIYTCVSYNLWALLICFYNIELFVHNTIRIMYHRILTTNVTMCIRIENIKREYSEKRAKRDTRITWFDLITYFHGGSLWWLHLYYNWDFGPVHINLSLTPLQTWGGSLKTTIRAFWYK